MVHKNQYAVFHVIAMHELEEHGLAEYRPDIHFDELIEVDHIFMRHGIAITSGIILADQEGNAAVIQGAIPVPVDLFAGFQKGDQVLADEVCPGEQYFFGGIVLYQKFFYDWFNGNGEFSCHIS